MVAQELIDLFRTDAADTAEPYLWSTPELVTYIDAAQRALVRGFGGIMDRTSALTAIALEAGVSTVPKPKGVLRVEGATLLTARRKLEINPANRVALHDLVPGDVRALITDADDKIYLLDAIVQQPDTLQLSVRRLPLKRVLDEDAALEVDDVHIDGLLVGVKAKAYAKQDAETFDRAKSERYEQEFRGYIATTELEVRATREPVRVLGYGGY